jgi:hypothetical protein
MTARVQRELFPRLAADLKQGREPTAEARRTRRDAEAENQGKARELVSSGAGQAEGLVGG